MINFIKYQKHYIMILAILFVVVSLSGTTYSLFLRADTTNTFNYNTGSLNLEFTEDKPITLESAFPKLDSEGEKQTPYNLTVKNTGTLTYLFDLNMLSSTNENIIDTKYIKIKVDNQKSHTLYQNKEIATNVILYPGEEKTFQIKIWLDYSAPNAELGKSFSAKIAATGNSIYKTLDASGANHPILKSNMLPVYYNDANNTWNKADDSNTINSYQWYDYDNKLWANSVILKNTGKQIYDITGKYNLKVDELDYNNENIVIKDKSFTIGFDNYKYPEISNFIRIKFDDLTEEKIHIFTNGQISYYYDTKNNNFVFQNGDNFLSTKQFNIEQQKWYILGFTYDQNNIKMYIEGNNILNGQLYGQILSNNQFQYGIDNKLEETSNITIGDIMLYNSILTDNQILNNYKDTISIIYDNLLAGYNKFIPMTKEEYYQSLPIGTIINNDDISSFFVWIPRFKYKLWNVTGEVGIDSYNAYQKGIEIEFENNDTNSGTIYCQENECYSDELMITKVTKNDNGKFYTHPAFTKTDNETTGFWISKYELSSFDNNCESNIEECIQNGNINSKPNNLVLRNTTFSNFYRLAKNFNTNDSYHIIKNTEWGAISYLAHSKYGLCQNNQCSNIKANQTFVSGSEIGDTTTLNMTGVFDMAGSAIEWTMSNYTQNKESDKETITLDDTKVNKNDYNLYYEDTFILGDATKELSQKEGIWYNASNIKIDETNNWLIRGGIANTDNHEIFSYSATTNNKNEYITSRIVTD